MARRISVAIFVVADAEKPLAPVVVAGEVPFFKHGMTKAEIKDLITRFNTGAPSLLSERPQDNASEPTAKELSKTHSGSEPILIRHRLTLGGA